MRPPPLAYSCIQAERRLRDGRPTPIDLIAKNLHLTDEFEPDLVEPWRYFDGLMLDDTQELVDGMHDYKVGVAPLSIFPPNP